MSTHNLSGRRNHRRRGAAAVEMAVCMPFVFILMVGSIELSAGLFHQYAVRLAAHECAIAAADGTGTADDVQEVAMQILSQRDITDFDIELVEVTRSTNISSVEPAPISQFSIPATGAAPAGLDEVPRGTIFRLTVSADRPPIAGLGFSRRFIEETIVAECVFVKEL